jgi:hypothetical protein
MQATKAICFMMAGILVVWLIYSFVNVRQDSRRLSVEFSAYCTQTNELAKLQKEMATLAPIRKSLAVEAELRREVEARRKDQTEIAILEKRIAGHLNNQKTELEHDGVSPEY